MNQILLFVVSDMLLCVFAKILPGLCSSGGYEAGHGVWDNTFGWKPVGQELRPNDVTTDLTPFQHGNRALASKDMKKSQGKL